MSFYNPYMKGPDFGQGVGDISSQIMQMLMMKKMFPDGGGMPQGKSPIPQQGGQGMMGQAPPMPSGQQPPQGNMGFGGEGDDVIMQKIMAALKAFGGGQGGF